MEKKEFKIFLLIAGLVIFFTTLPFLFSQIIQLSSGDYYTNIDFNAGYDKTIYFSYIEQARQGHLFFKNLYTSEPQVARLFFPLWLVLGYLGKILNFNNILIFHLARIIMAFIFLYLLYLFLKKYFSDQVQRIVIFCFLIFSSGFGFIPFIALVLKNQLISDLFYEKIGTDMWISESNTFLTIYHSALFILSQIIILIIFWYFLRNLDFFSYKKTAILFFLTLFLGIFHTYDIVIVDAVLGIFLILYFIIRKKIIWPSVCDLFFVMLASVLSVTYFLIIFNQEIALKGWLEQNIITSPKLSNYIIGYGFISLFFLIGVIPVFRKRQDRFFLFILVWSLVQLILIYTPFKFETKLSNGWHLPLGIVAGVGFFWLIEKMKTIKITNQIINNKIIAITIINLIIFFSVAGTLLKICLNLAIAQAKVMPNYLTPNEYQAILWLKDNVKENEIILAEPTNGNIIPSLSGRVVFIGHGHQTINWDKKSIYYQWFFKDNNSKNDQNKKDWLKNEGIDYVFFSKLEDDLGDFQPAEKDYLKLIYKNKEVKIFKVE